MKNRIPQPGESHSGTPRKDRKLSHAKIITGNLNIHGQPCQAGHATPFQYQNIMKNTQTVRLSVVLLLLLSLFVRTGVQAQDSIRVTGVVVNGDNTPLAGVSIGVEGSFELPVVTDEKGRFSVVSPRAAIG